MDQAMSPTGTQDLAHMHGKIKPKLHPQLKIFLQESRKMYCSKGMWSVFRDLCLTDFRGGLQGSAP